MTEGEQSSEDDEEFVVHVITNSDGTQTIAPSAPVTAPREDLLGVGQYSDSNSSSLNAPEEQSQVPNGTSPRPSTDQAKKSKRKRVHFALNTDANIEHTAKALRLTTSAAADPETSELEEQELQKDMARFKEMLGLVRDKDDADADIAAAEDAREEEFQNSLKTKIEQLRKVLRGELSTSSTQTPTTLSLDGEEIQVKMRAGRKVEQLQKEGRTPKATGSEKGRDDSDEDESDNDIDLMHDWTQFEN